MKKKIVFSLFTIILIIFAPTMFHSLLISMPFMVCAFMAVQLCLECRLHPERRPLKWLAAWAIACTLLYGGHYVYFHRATWLMPVSDTIYATMNLTVYPLYLIYISELTDMRPISSRPARLVILTIMSLLAGISIGTLYLIASQEDTIRFIYTYLYRGRQGIMTGLPLAMMWIHRICHVLFGLQAIGVAVAGIRKVRRYNRALSHLYADTDDKEIRSVSTLLILLIVTSIFSVIFNYLGRHQFLDNEWLAVPSLAFTALLFLIGWTGLQQRFSIHDIKAMAATTVETENQGSTAKESRASASEETTAMGQRLEKLMHEQRLYLQHDLRLDEVARQLGTNRTYLLRTLNEVHGMTFKEYVNRLRISHAEHLMSNDPTLTKADVATLSGYNTISSFYRNFNTYRTR